MSVPRSYLIAGGGSGIGAACAELLAGEGHHVMICGRREASLRTVADRVGCGWVRADCADPDQATAAVAEVLDRYGRLDGLVCSAGTMLTAPVLDTSPADWAATMHNNAGVAFHLARAALPALISTRGALVFISSIAALRSATAAAAYSAAKAAVIALARAIAVEHGPDGVRANVVCPGWVRTEMADAEMLELGEDPVRGYAEITALVPQRRAAQPAEVAAAVAWLSGPGASYVNGAVLTVDGGTTLVDAGTVGFDFTVTPRRRV